MIGIGPSQAYGPGSPPPIQAWVRPQDWLPLPAPGAETFIGLFAVFNTSVADSNRVGIIFEGNYTVNWGDGTIENVASGVQRDHAYDYATLPASTTTSFGYRQAIVVVTPQAGQHLTLINLDVRPAAFIAAEFPVVPWLDILINMPNCVTQTVAYYLNVGLGMCQQITVLTLGSCASVLGLFASSPSIQSTPLFDTSNVTDFVGMYEYNVGIREIPPFKTSNGTNFGSIFSNTLLLETGPDIDISNATALGAMFQNSHISSIPSYNTSKCSDFRYMFCGADTIREIPAIDVSGAGPGALDFMFNNGTDFSYSLAKCSMTGIGASVDFTNSLLSTAAIVEIFGNLKTAVGQTITVTGNYGSAGLTAPDLLIATAKGWTVVQ